MNGFCRKMRVLDRRAQKDSELQLFVIIAFLCNSLQEAKYIEAEEKQYDMSCCAEKICRVFPPYLLRG